MLVKYFEAYFEASFKPILKVTPTTKNYVKFALLKMVSRFAKLDYITRTVSQDSSIRFTHCSSSKKEGDAVMVILSSFDGDVTERFMVFIKD